MNSKIFRFIIPLLLVLVCVVLASCFGRCNKMYWVLNTIDWWRDAIKIQLHISRNVISRKDILDYKECFNNYIDTNKFFNEEACERFDFNFTITNTNRTDIQIPVSGLTFGGEGYGSDIRIVLWSDTWKYWSFPSTTSHPYPCTRPDYELATLKSNESLNYPSSFNLYDIFSNINSDYPNGVFNMYIIYTSRLLKNSIF